MELQAATEFFARYNHHPRKLIRLYPEYSPAQIEAGAVEVWRAIQGGEKIEPIQMVSRILEAAEKGDCGVYERHYAMSAKAVERHDLLMKIIIAEAVAAGWLALNYIWSLLT